MTTSSTPTNPSPSLPPKNYHYSAAASSGQPTSSSGSCRCPLAWHHRRGSAVDLDPVPPNRNATGGDFGATSLDEISSSASDMSAVVSWTKRSVPGRDECRTRLETYPNEHIIQNPPIGLYICVGTNEGEMCRRPERDRHPLLGGVGDRHVAARTEPTDDLVDVRAGQPGAKGTYARPPRRGCARRASGRPPAVATSGSLSSSRCGW